jgi:hypothetical protein
MKSKFMTIDTRDLLHGLFIAFVTTILAGIIEMLQTGATFDWPTLKPVLIAGISAALSYLLKSLLSNSRNQLFKKEPD